MITNDAHPDRPIDTRLKIAALWTATMLIFAYVDLFSLYRPDVRADIEAGKVFAFDIGQPFLFFATLYVVIPAVMIYLSLVLPRKVNRIANLVLAGLYAITIGGGAIGEWNYYVLGSVIEAVLLAMVIRHAWTWPEPGFVLIPPRQCDHPTRASLAPPQVVGYPQSLVARIGLRPESRLLDSLIGSARVRGLAGATSTGPPGRGANDRPRGRSRARRPRRQPRSRAASRTLPPEGCRGR